jgi:hypothetical protein
MSDARNSLIKIVYHVHQGNVGGLTESIDQLQRAFGCSGPVLERLVQNPKTWPWNNCSTNQRRLLLPWTKLRGGRENRGVQIQPRDYCSDRSSLRNSSLTNSFALWLVIVVDICRSVVNSRQPPHSSHTDESATMSRRFHLLRWRPGGSTCSFPIAANVLGPHHPLQSSNLN